MKMSLKGKRSLISMWERQNRNCVLCGQPITAETSMAHHEPAEEWQKPPLFSS